MGPSSCELTCPVTARAVGGSAARTGLSVAQANPTAVLAATIVRTYLFNMVSLTRIARYSSRGGRSGGGGGVTSNPVSGRGRQLSVFQRHAIFRFFTFSRLI